MEMFNPALSFSEILTYIVVSLALLTLLSVALERIANKTLNNLIGPHSMMAQFRRVHKLWRGVRLAAIALALATWFVLMASVLISFSRLRGMIGP